MEIKKVKLVFFSPTGTTRSVLEGIVKGINPELVEMIDITSPEARKNPYKTEKEDVLLIGVPVYMGRVPSLLEEWFSHFEADNTPAVCVVVYGNRAYENSLLELNDIVKKCGGLPVAGAAYIGEHSFSDSSTPVAMDRPDYNDLNHAAEFGIKIREKLENYSSSNDISEFSIPGEYPYGGVTDLWDVDFIEVNGTCAQCGECADVCPMGAIDPDDSSLIDIEKCITCCACIKHCPQEARSIKPSPVADAQTRLRTLYSEPKQPECFI